MVEFKVEVIVLPVSDVDRAKEFYTRIGFREDVDYVGADGFRVVHLTPPGSAASIARVMANFGFSDLVLVALADINDDEGRGARVAGKDHAADVGLALHLAHGTAEAHQLQLQAQLVADADGRHDDAQVLGDAFSAG